MPERKKVAVNTTPLLSLLAATGGLRVLQHLYEEVHIPAEVVREIQAGGRARSFGRAEVLADSFVIRHEKLRTINPLLRRSLDLGEASVIQLAQDLSLKLVAIDEMVGRRIARLSGLQVTGSIGILIKAKETGFPLEIRTALERMRQRGIWLSAQVAAQALKLAGEE